MLLSRWVVVCPECGEQGVWTVQADAYRQAAAHAHLYHPEPTPAQVLQLVGHPVECDCPSCCRLAQLAALVERELAEVRSRAERADHGGAGVDPGGVRVAGEPVPRDPPGAQWLGPDLRPFPHVPGAGPELREVGLRQAAAATTPEEG